MGQQRHSVGGLAIMIIDRQEMEQPALASRLRAIPGWARFVAAVVALGAVVTAWAVSDVVRHGFYRPALFGDGAFAVWAISYVYLTVVRKGDVLEAIDLSEAPVVAVALVLPPGEAILAVVAGSVLSQLQPRRSVAKRAFNVGIRAVGMGALELVASLVGHRHNLAAGWPIAVVIPCTVLYTLVGALGIATVVKLAQGEGFLSGLLDAWQPRTVAFVASTVIGACAATVALFDPYALAGVSSALGLVWYTTRALRREQSERHRLECLLGATTRIMDAGDDDGREKAALDAAEELLLWRDVEVRDRPPGEDEFGIILWTVRNRTRWLVARPRRGGDSWSDTDQRILDAIRAASVAAYSRAQSHEELEQFARLDPLTGVANRREFDAVLDTVLEQESQAAVVLFDLDSFKPVNDTFGHETGDELLRAVAGRVSALVRTTDVVARMGGDEFVVLLPGATPTVARRTAAEICESLAEPVHIGSLKLTISASAGIAVAPDDGVVRSELMRTADRRMYQAKGASRGKVHPPEKYPALRSISGSSPR